MNHNRKMIIEENEVSQLYTFQLGAFQQKVLIEGRKKELPIIISLHGGPGTPIPFSVGCRGMFKAFTDKFIMIYWDQYGCGINNAKIDDSFTIELFVKMTEDLLDEVKKLFPQNKVYIFATSWGSILSAKLLENSYDFINGVVVWGQIVKKILYNSEVFNEIERSSHSFRKLERIKAVDIRNITGKDLKLISSCIRKYTNGYENKNGKKAPMGEIVKGLITSPDYKFKDFKAIMVNGYMGNLSLWKEILEIDLTEILCNVTIPYIMIQGDTDIVAPTTYIQDIVHKAGNPQLECIVVNNSGHYPGIEGMDIVLEKLVDISTLQ